MLISRFVSLCLEVERVWWPYNVNKAPPATFMSTCLSFPLFCCFCLAGDANLLMCQAFARFISNQTPPANLLASCDQPGDTLLWVLKASLTRSRDPRRCRARSTRRVNIATWPRRARPSPCRPCHSQQKSLSISTGSKCIMVLGTGGGLGGRRTKYWSRSYHLWLTDQPCDFATRVSKKKEKKRKAPPSASNVAASAQHKRRWAGLVYKYTGKRRRRISIKTSALMGLTAVITRRRFQIRLLR